MPLGKLLNGATPGGRGSLLSVPSSRLTSRWTLCRSRRFSLARETCSSAPVPAACSFPSLRRRSRPHVILMARNLSTDGHADRGVGLSTLRSRTNDRVGTIGVPPPLGAPALESDISTTAEQFAMYCDI